LECIGGIDGLICLERKEMNHTWQQEKSTKNNREKKTQRSSGEIGEWRRRIETRNR